MPTPPHPSGMSQRPDCVGDCLEHLGEDLTDFRSPTLRSAINGHLACLRHAHQTGTRWDERTCRCASLRGHLACLRYLHENGCPWDERTCSYASDAGQLECLRYAHENGCPWDEDACVSASHSGNLECLRYLHEHGCPWNQLTCSRASAFGRLECLRYAHENGCPWDEDTVTFGVCNDHSDCWQYAVENGCPYTEVVTRMPPLVSFLYHRGLPIPTNDPGYLKDHIRGHVRKAWVLVRCTLPFLTAYREACERVYAPGGRGYQEAETSFRRTALERPPYVFGPIIGSE